MIFKVRYHIGGNGCRVRTLSCFFIQLSVASILRTGNGLSTEDRASTCPSRSARWVERWVQRWVHTSGAFEQKEVRTFRSFHWNKTKVTTEPFFELKAYFSESLHPHSNNLNLKGEKHKKRGILEPRELSPQSRHYENLRQKVPMSDSRNYDPSICGSEFVKLNETITPRILIQMQAKNIRST